MQTHRHCVVADVNSTRSDSAQPSFGQRFCATAVWPSSCHADANLEVTMAERHGVGISNREAPEEEARERQEHPARPEDEAGETEPQIRDGQSSTKSGAKASAQKKASTRHTEDTHQLPRRFRGVR